MGYGGRPRAGHGWTAFYRKGQMIWLMGRWDGTWALTSEAINWPRCVRCRGPHEQSPFNSGMCSTCYFYKYIDVKDFWRLHNAGFELAPYNIGRRLMQHTTAWDRRPLEDPKIDWRAYLKTQVPPPRFPQDEKNLWEPISRRAA